jgi:outer membrane protein assembly factor BamE (lipoprotein component of BamABCDE complex)
MIRKISLGEVELGMTKQQVREALVSPQPYYAELKGDRWSYVDDIVYSREGEQEFGKILFFKDDKVVKIKNFLRVPDQLINIEWE